MIEQRLVRPRRSSATGRTARCSCATDTGRLLTRGRPRRTAARALRRLGRGGKRPIVYDPAAARSSVDELALFGAFHVETPAGEIACRPAFELVAEHCGRYPPERVAGDLRRRRRRR